MGDIKANCDPVVTDISGEGEPDITEIESLCVKCEEQGMTRLLLTKIPYYKEVIVSSFTCGHCGHTNSELQPASRIQDMGQKCRVKISNAQDLSRHVVLSNAAAVSIPEVELEIPPNKGSLTTIEGILEKVIVGLEQDQEVRKVQHPDTAEKISIFIEKLKRLKDGHDLFTLEIDDISGNSFVENPLAPSHDPQTTLSQYTRTAEQDERLGIQTTQDVTQDSSSDSLHNEVLHLDSDCPSCRRPCPLNMKLVEIPHFKEVVIMAMTCDACGYRSNEVKGGAGISPQARCITLHIQGPDDLKRDLLKSETSLIRIPELEFETASGSLGGKFTTVEGILTDIKDSLRDLNPFVFGDSSVTDQRTKLDTFCTKLTQIIEGSVTGVHLVIDDAAGNSYIENPLAPEPDSQLEIVDSERTFDQNEELGLNDMNTETYERL